MIINCEYAGKEKCEEHSCCNFCGEECILRCDGHHENCLYEEKKGET